MTSATVETGKLLMARYQEVMVYKHSYQLFLNSNPQCGCDRADPAGVGGKPEDHDPGITGGPSVSLFSGTH